MKVPWVAAAIRARCCNVERVKVERALSGIEVWAVADTRIESIIAPGYMFGIPDAGWRGQVPARFWCQGAIHRTVGAGLLVFEPGELVVNHQQDIRPMSHSVIVDPVDLGRYVDREVVRGLELTQRELHDPRVLGVFDGLVRAFEDPDAELIEREHAVHRFVMTLLRATNDRPARRPSPRCPRAVATTRDVIQARYAEALSLEELARIAGVSVFHLERSFTRAVGVPIHRYQQLIRLHRAMQLIRLGESLAEVAATCGFADQAHMTRTFRRLHGWTPGAYSRRR